MSAYKYAVVGAGNGGQCVAAYLKLMGYEVTLYDRFEAVIKPILARGGIHLKGTSLNGFAKLDLVTTDIGSAVKGADIIFVILPAFAHAYIAEQLSSVLQDGQVIVLCPGSTGGVLEFKHILKEKNCKAAIKLAETNSMFYACRVDETGDAVIGGVKKTMPIAALPTSDTDAIIDMLQEPYPQLVKEQNVLASDMSNLNAVIHPLPVLLNIGWIEKTKGDFKYYYDGITPTVGRLIEKLDVERMLICEAFGLHVSTLRESMMKYYQADGETLSEMVGNVAAYSIVKSPPQVESRLLTEDIPMGLVPMIEYAKLVGVETPFMEMVVTLASLALNKDLRAVGRTRETLGIGGMDKKALLSYIQ